MKKKLGELLLEAGLINQEQLSAALEHIRSHRGEKVGQAIIKKGFATEIDIAQTIAFQMSLPFVELSSKTLDPKVVMLIHERLAVKHLCIPINCEGRDLELAMYDPLNFGAIDEVRFVTSMNVRPCVATLSDISNTIKKFFHSEPIEDAIENIEEASLVRDNLVEVVRDAEREADLSEQIKKSSAPPIIKLVDSILVYGVVHKAHDIHVEPQEKNVSLRVRIDGILRETMQFPKWVQGPIVSRIKIMARLDIAERRIPQDGRIRVKVNDKNIDIRVSTLPTQYGETVVMRLLDSSYAPELGRLGLLPQDHDRIVEMIQRPQGIVIATGPTGSGKTSLLYSMLRHIKSVEIKIVTIEDPIEYELQGVSQVAINERAGLTFAHTLRSVLRQDPDVIMVGEIRDLETATIAHQAALTGHLVFTSLHTNDAVSSVVRLKNLGLPPYLIASALNGIVALRLVRLICRNCREEYAPGKEELALMGLKPGAGLKLWRGKGCKECGDKGYTGRTGIFEVLTIDDNMRHLISENAPERELKKAALDAGMCTLQEDGFKKAGEGITSLDELSRIIYIPKPGVYSDISAVKALSTSAEPG